MESLPVDLVPIGEFTQLNKGEKTAELKEKPNESTAKEANKKAPEPDKTAGEAKAELQTPPTPRPTNQSVAAQEASAPPPTPEPAPVKPAPVKPAAEPAPKAEPEPVKQAVAEAAPAEEAPKPLMSEPVKVTPRSKPTPPKPQQQTAQQQPKKEEKFNPNEISALLNKVDPSGGGTTGAKEAASLGSRTGNNNVKMTVSELDALRGQIAKCWNPPVGAAGAADLAVRLQFNLSLAGEVEGSPRVINSSGNPSFRAASDSAVRAVMRCQPYALPAEKYDAWREVIINFDPSQMLGAER
ncbi:energy transducer TonB [Pannonibacter sp. Pt2-lr]